MEPMETALIISAFTDILFRLGSAGSDMTPEEYKAEVEALQIKADGLEDWLKKE